MRALPSWALGLLALAAAGCDLDFGSSATSPPAPPPAPTRIVGLRANGVTATAVGEKLAVLIDGVNELGGTVWALDYELGAATCDLPGCSAVVDGYAVVVTSSAPGVAHVTVTTKGNAAVSAVLEIPFRVATKLVVTRALDDSPAGSAFAMVPGDVQSWYVSPGDDEGPLAAPTSAIRRTLDGEDASPRCLDDAWYAPVDRADARSKLRCTFGSDTPTSLQLSFSYAGIVRNETVRVVPLLPVREASLLVCRVTKREEKQGTFTEIVTVPTAVDEASLPCVAVTSIVHGSGACDEVRDRILVPRLLLDDGTIALGGAQYLSRGAALSTSTKGVSRIPTGKGTIFGRYGAGIIAVPYDVDPSCGP